ncbi:MAG: hypothetical protein ABI321_22310, partial [Polyangia bacterium]
NANDIDDPEGARDDRDKALAVWARRALERKFGALPPASNLDDELLVRYVDGALNGPERQSFEARLLLDLDAKERVGILAGALHEAGYPSPKLPDGFLVKSAKATRYVFHIAKGVFEVLRGEGIAALQPELAVRSGHGGTGHASAYQIEREFQTAQGPLTTRIELHADPSSTHPRVDLVIHVGADGRSTSGVRAKLLRDGRPVDSREIEEHGCTFAHLDPARYDLELRKGGVEVGKLMLDLRG